MDGVREDVMLVGVSDAEMEVYDLLWWVKSPGLWSCFELSDVRDILILL